MIKLFVTGDNHFGKKYDRFSMVKDQLIESRFECLRDMVRKAEEMSCDMFIVTGDLFDNINNIKTSDVNKIVEILASFNNTVLVLPGNHDYYSGDEKVWRTFENALSSQEHNITLLNEFRRYSFDAGEEVVNIYPAYCQSKHSKENNLGWIKDAEVEVDGEINIGVAHGAIKGITPDMKEEYFLMTEDELNSIPMDAWLIGHTHVPYPNVLKENEDTTGYKIFNAGTHEQTDYHNNTEGNAFVIAIEKSGTTSKVMARKYVSGKVRFYDIDVNVRPESETALADSISEALTGLSENAVVRLNISGSVKPAEYCEKDRIYREMLSDYLTYEIRDDKLSEEITVEKIRSEYAETSFAAMFMEQLINNPTELQMAYELIKECSDNNQGNN